MTSIVRSLSIVFLVPLLIAGAATAQEATPGGSPTAVTCGRWLELPLARILVLSPDGKRGH
jgi:hypothetical protein